VAARPGERRVLAALERVAAQKLGGAGEYLRKRIEALKSK